MRRSTSPLALVLAASLAASPAAAEPRPVGLRPDPTSVEAGLWGLSDRAEQHVRQSAELNTNPALNAYVREVACKVAVEYCADLRVYVLDRPFVNATMAPNGYTEVWSGLLLRATDEAEFAYVLSHEVGHFAENHSLERQMAMKSRANVALAVSVGIAVLGVAAATGSTSQVDAQNVLDATGNLIDAVYLGTMASLFKFTREQESEADQLGIRRSSAAGYAASSAADMWLGIIAETTASDFERVRKSDARLGVFSTHPLSAARAEALQKTAATLPAAGEHGRARHRAAIRPHLGAWLRDDLRRRDFGQTLYILDRLARDGEDLGVLNFYRGEAYRLRRGEGDLAKARQAYALAATFPDAPVAAWRELGDLARRDDDRPAARAAYEAYLAKASGADDAWMVREALDGLGEKT